MTRQKELLKIINALAVLCSFLLLPIFIVLSATHVEAQSFNQWSPQQRIPGYGNDANPPYLIADQNRTVHAFTSQQVGDEGKEIAIVYNQWTLAKGWTSPTDILLSPLKHDARILGIFLDQAGIIHLIFFGGDEVEANLYYASAPVAYAAKAPAWSEPLLVGQAAVSPSTAALAGDDHGNLTIIYSGDIEGRGIYVVNSTDSGKTWSGPISLFLTYSDMLWPFDLQLYSGQSDWLHAVWSVQDITNQGRGIYYANSTMQDHEWSEPLKLADSPRGLGTKVPSITEQRGELLVIYIMTPKITMRRSSDGGQTWTNPATLFSQHVGVNGELSLVLDGKADLHLLFGQRITADPDIHGMWHSLWQGGDQWFEPKAVVSGPLVEDTEGDKSFDPVMAHAIISQGNTLLVTWRTDPGLKGNGVWYAYNTLDVPESPLAAIVIPTLTPTPAVLPTSIVLQTIPTATPRRAYALTTNAHNLESRIFVNLDGPAWMLIMSIGPSILLIIGVVVRSFYHRNHS